MKRLEQWKSAGKIAQFVAGNLDATTHALIFEAAKTNPALRAAINDAKSTMMGELLGMAKAQDPNALIDSGLLEQYAAGNLDEAQCQQIELMAMAHPKVSLAMDVLKRERADNLLLSVQKIDPLTLIASSLLIDYVLGECSEADQLMVEAARVHFPEIAAELSALEAVDEGLMMRGAIHAPQRVKESLNAKFDALKMPADGWGLIMPPLGQSSTSQDFLPWLENTDTAAFNPAENLNVFPLDANRDMLTLFVIVRDRLEIEVHIDSIERFLVLEGSCVIEMEGSSIELGQGDFYSIPKFTPHTVVVTSTTPCKLIVQQVAA